MLMHTQSRLLVVRWTLIILCLVSHCLLRSGEVYADDSAFVLEWSPPDEPPLELNEMEAKCTIALKSIAATESEKKSQLLLRRALLRNELEMDDECRSDLVEADQLSSGNLDIQLYMGRFVLLQVSRIEEAVRLADQMVSDAPEGYQGYLLRAECDLVQRRYKFALRDLNAAVKLAPWSIEPRLRRATANNNIGDLVMLEEDMKVVNRLPPCFESYGGTIYALNGLVHYGKGEYENAIPFFLRSIAIRKRCHRSVQPVFHVALWYSYVITARPASAEWLAFSVKSSQPMSSHAHAMCALIEADRGDLDSALKSANRAVALAPKNCLALSSLGRVLTTRGEYASALRSFEVPIDEISQAEDSDVALRLAFLKSVAPEAELRNGTEANRLIDVAMKKKEPGNHPYIFLIRACAAAEISDFESAIQSVNQCLEVKDLSADVRRTAIGLSELFREKKPYRIGDLPLEQEFKLPAGVRLKGNAHAQ